MMKLTRELPSSVCDKVTIFSRHWNKYESFEPILHQDQDQIFPKIFPFGIFCIYCWPVIYSTKTFNIHIINLEYITILICRIIFPAVTGGYFAPAVQKKSYLLALSALFSVTLTKIKILRVHKSALLSYLVNRNWRLTEVVTNVWFVWVGDSIF